MSTTKFKHVQILGPKRIVEMEM